jgi:hypothetical protein
MTTENQSTNTPARRGLSPESARKILAEGRVTRNGQTIYVMTNTLSELPAIKNESLTGMDFNIIRLSGEVTTEFGEAWIFEIGRNPETPTHSWLVGKPSGNSNDSVVGKNLKRHFDKNGPNALPLWVHLEYHDQGRGNAYYALETPQALLEKAQDVPPPAPVADPGDNQRRAAPAPEPLDDLPF